MPERVRVKGVLAKIEATYKTDAAPAAATDGIQVEDHIWSQLVYGYLEANTRENVAYSGFGKAGSAPPGGRFGKLTLVVAVKGAGAAYAAGVRPEVDVLLRICGHSSTVDTTLNLEKVTYKPIHSGFESATLWAYSSGSLFKMVGCRGMMTRLEILPSQIARMTFEVNGVIVADPTDVAIPAITYPRVNVIPPVVKGAGMTLNGVDLADFSSYTFEQRAEVVERPRGNDPEGHAGYEIVNMDPHFTATIDKPALATFNPYTLYHAGTLFGWDIAVGAVAYNRMKLSGPAGRIAEAPHSDDRGLAMMDLRVSCHNSNLAVSNDMYTITFD